MPDERPLRIIHCFRSPVGGIFRHVRDLVLAHAAQGHQVGLLCDSTTGGDFETALFEALKPHLALGLVRLPIRRAVSPSDAATLWRSLREIGALKPDILHGHGAKGGVLSRLAGTALRLRGQPIVRLYSPHGGSLHYDPATLSGKAVFSVERLQESLTDCLVFVCDFERRTYERKVGQPCGRAERIYNGIADSEFEPVPPWPGAADFLYIGMLRDLKGPDLFVEAFARTERRLGEPLTGMMIGDGPQRDAYARMILESGLAQRIEMMPAMPAREAFALAHAVVLPSRAESLPYVALEALAARKPIIAANVGGIPEILGSQSPALARSNDAESLSDIMTAAITEPGWADRAMPNAETFRRRFSASTMAADMMALYRDLLASRRLKGSSRTA
ncbi:glycosyl transferase [Xaviernesmea oryzae]|uniref:Glycosyl transferase n=1 Tax=Xaviernesmea oryzae TaxID=464029 RepID=A0A1Q9AWU0_9HYPH|nr:glycosyltransferase family 4 protein [Xaviernesmea oryzae]OLP59921.1 glycosyl transferase [Xaviernesmea oryzae]SEK45070.1 Glycosyltransferase involved in cell wall bisynthesis [Xaviernesmea oryzae]